MIAMRNPVIITIQPACPECIQGKHQNCTGQVLLTTTDDFAPCQCCESDHLGVIAELVKARIEEPTLDGGTDTTWVIATDHCYICGEENFAPSHTNDDEWPTPCPTGLTRAEADRIRALHFCEGMGCGPTSACSPECEEEYRRAD